PDATRKLDLGRVTQQLSIWAQHYRQLAGIDVKAFDQCLGASVGFGVQSLLGMSIAAEEALQPEDVAVSCTADNQRAPNPGPKQADTAEYEGAHDPLPELRLGNQQRAKLAWSNNQRFNRSLRVRVNKRRPAPELCKLAEERANVVSDNRRVAVQKIVPGHI